MDTVVCDECKGRAEFVAVVNDKTGRHELYVCQVCGHENKIATPQGRTQTQRTPVKSFPR